MSKDEAINLLRNADMCKEIIGFGNTENEKHKFHRYKNAIF